MNTLMLFLGLDLAWGQKNTSGGVVIEYDGIHPANVVSFREDLGDDEEIIAWVRRWMTAPRVEGLLIGVDAPLLVPNETGKRPAEAEIGRRFAKYQAGAHPANRRILGLRIRGEDLVSAFADLGVIHDPYLSTQQSAVARVMEVFPHPAHVILFGLARTLKYKAKPGRDYPSRWAAMNQYAGLLRNLCEQAPPLRLPADWPPLDVSGLRGGALKRLEDGLDALTCAYIVYYYWYYGPAGAEVIGDMTGGYIVVPRRVF